MEVGWEELLADSNHEYAVAGNTSDTDDSVDSETELLLLYSCFPIFHFPFLCYNSSRSHIVAMGVLQLRHLWGGVLAHNEPF